MNIIKELQEIRFEENTNNLLDANINATNNINNTTTNNTDSNNTTNIDNHSIVNNNTTNNTTNKNGGGFWPPPFLHSSPSTTKTSPLLFSNLTFPALIQPARTSSKSRGDGK